MSPLWMVLWMKDGAVGNGIGSDMLGLGWVWLDYSGIFWSSLELNCYYIYVYVYHAVKHVRYL